MRLPAWTFACSLSLACAAANASPVTLQDIRLWASPASTRVVLDLSAPASYSMFSLDGPDRVVIDLDQASGNIAALRLPAGTGSVGAVRIGKRDGGGLRVVLDVSARVQPKSFLTPPNETYGHRLVIDLALEQTPRPVKATNVDGQRDVVVAIDAGHGGEDPGAIGKAGTREKVVALAVAKKLAARINAEPGMRAVLTRTGDYFVPFSERIKRARTANADLFVSIHADAFVNREVRGSSVYVLSTRRASNEAARMLADRENAADLIGGVSLHDKSDVLASVLFDLSQNAAISASREAAARVLVELDHVGQLKKTDVQHASLMVLTSPDVPSMLVETAYISNPEEERRLRDPAHQGKLAGAIHAGLRRYFYDNPPPGSRVATLAALERGQALRHVAPPDEAMRDVSVAASTIRDIPVAGT
jgi:N-acetylmuramoyl-L-alanine amidase